MGCRGTYRPLATLGTRGTYVFARKALPVSQRWRKSHRSHAVDGVGSNASPSNGRAESGQSAALNSYCKLPLVDTPNGAPLDVAFENRASLLKQLEAYMKSFVDKRGLLLTISVNDCEKLKAAQKEPEKYRDLKIRIGGFQAYFTDLPPEMQDWQIKKCEQYAGA